MICPFKASLGNGSEASAYVSGWCDSQCPLWMNGDCAFRVIAEALKREAPDDPR